jgi:hypothetical protein
MHRKIRMTDKCNMIDERLTVKYLWGSFRDKFLEGMRWIMINVGISRIQFQDIIASRTCSEQMKYGYEQTDGRTYWSTVHIMSSFLALCEGFVRVRTKLALVAMIMCSVLQGTCRWLTCPRALLHIFVVCGCFRSQHVADFNGFLNCSLHS